MWLICPECRDESAFEQPPCADGHGHDCPEWYCVTCGFAVFAGGWDRIRTRSPASRSAPRPSPAASPSQRADRDHHALSGRCLDDSAVELRDAPRPRPSLSRRPASAARASGLRWARALSRARGRSPGVHLGRRCAAGSRRRRVTDILIREAGRPTPSRPHGIALAATLERGDVELAAGRLGRPARSGGQPGVGRHVPDRLLRARRRSTRR